MAAINIEEPSPSTKRLFGKVAIVTGGAMGIGKSIVRLLWNHGAKVCIVDVEDEVGRHVCESIGDDQHVCFFHCDVTAEDDVRRAINFTVDRFGTLDIMVNNAGIVDLPCSNIPDVDLSEFEKVFSVNVKGVFLGMKHAARIMIPLKKGTIISISSVSSTIGGLGSHAYTGSKHAVLGLTRSVAAELGKHGIRVNCVSPYAVPTRLAMPYLPEEERTEEALAGFRAFCGRHANLQGVDLMAEDVANAVLFLASDESRYISGDNLMVDGGFTCTNHSLQVFRSKRGQFRLFNEALECEALPQLLAAAIMHYCSSNQQTVASVLVFASSSTVASFVCLFCFRSMGTGALIQDSGELDLSLRQRDSSISSPNIV